MRRILIILFLSAVTIFPQNLTVNKIEPANWWPGMKLNKIQLMVYGKNLSDFKVTSNTRYIKTGKIHFLKNSDYSFVDVTITPDARPGDYKLNFTRKGETVSANFPLLKRNRDKNEHIGFNRDDVIYLIMPDRFADGNKENNTIEGMINDYRPGDPLSRHGGDIEGIINHLNYFTDLGVTALWLTPVIENNKQVSYHGYAATDLYMVDRRLGTNELYKQFVEKAHAKGLKVIYDHVSNHIGTNHYWLKDLPMADWLNGTLENHLSTWHDKMIDVDIHGIDVTNEHLRKGWFVNDMADLNQQNVYVKNYLIQNTIWWIEYAGIDGIREDTYPYPDQKFLADWAKAIMAEYPRFNIVGEVWTAETSFLASFQRNSKLNRVINKFNTNLPAVTDFGIQKAYADFLEGKEGIYKIYETVTKDFLFPDPDNILTFADNHDLPRMMLLAKDNWDKVKLVLTHLLTARGVPEIFYGTEIGMAGGWDDGLKRTDFPGGFEGSKTNAFTREGRSEKENALFDFTKKLISLRKQYPSLAEGELKHLPPVDNVYAYYKKGKGPLMLVVLNGNDKEAGMDMSMIESLCGKNIKLYDVINNAEAAAENGKLVLKPYSGNIFRVNN